MSKMSEKINIMSDMMLVLVLSKLVTLSPLEQDLLNKYMLTVKEFIKEDL